MNRSILWFVTCLIVAVIGAGAGWYAAAQNQGEGEDAGGGHGHGHAHAAASPVEELSPQTLKNLGVTMGTAELSNFTRTVRVQATVMDVPLAHHALIAPIGGLVTKIHVRPGQVVQAGAPIASVAREPIARPTLELTADILNPVSETLHESVSVLRATSNQFAIAQTEYDRVKAIFDSAGDGMPVLPKQTLIDRGYDLQRARQAKENAEHELERHGLSKTEIESVRGGEHPPGNRNLWQRALAAHDLWGKTEAAIHSALDTTTRARPWAVAAIGELSAAGLATGKLAEALARNEAMRRHFVEVSSLLLSGHSLAHVQILASSGALEPICTLRAPATAPHWNVHKVVARVGQRLEAGAAIGDLYDGREAWLRMEPIGGEVSLVLRAFENKTMLRALPLVEGSAPKLEGLLIERLHSDSDQAGRTLATIRAANQAVDRYGLRSWRLRPGLRYVVHVPIATLQQRFVLPASALTDRGPDRVVYLPDGKTFRAVPVSVEYADESIAVVSHDGALFPGDVVVKTGAFALGLAMQAGTGAADPHAGHNHD